VARHFAQISQYHPSLNLLKQLNFLIDHLQMALLQLALLQLALLKILHHLILPRLILKVLLEKVSPLLVNLLILIPQQMDE